MIDDMRLSSGARSRDLKSHDNHISIQNPSKSTASYDSIQLGIDPQELLE
jgi:hypothetical protein